MLLSRYRLSQPNSRGRSITSSTLGGSLEGQTQDSTGTGSRVHSRQGSISQNDDTFGGSPSPSDDLNEPISGIGRHRARSPASSLEFTEHDRKRFKEEAQALAWAYKIPPKQLLKLTDVWFSL